MSDSQKLIQRDRTLMTQTGDLNRNEFQTLLRVINVVAKQTPPPVPAEPTLPQTAPPEPPEVSPAAATPAQQSSPPSPQVSAADSPYGSLPSAAQLKAGLDASESPYSVIPSALSVPLNTPTTLVRDPDAYGKFPAFDDKTPLTNVSQARRPTLTTVEQLRTEQPPQPPEKSDVQPARERRVMFAEKPDVLEFEKGSPPNQLRAESPEVDYRRNVVDVMDDSRAGHRTAREPSKNPFVKFFKNFLGKSAEAAAEKSQEAANKAESSESQPPQIK